MLTVAKLMQFMVPKPAPYSLIRLGGDGDGAYLLPDDLIGVTACFSPGVANRKDFEDELLKAHGIVSHMADFTSDEDKFRTPLIGGQSFRKKWLDTNGSSDSVSLEEWVDELEPNPEDDLILQMDIEGAEYRNLLGAPDHILKRFRIIILELHGLGAAQRAEDFEKELGPLINRLSLFFKCVHAHPNNCCGEFILHETGQNFPNIIELTLLRADRLEFPGKERLVPVALPHPLDIVRNVKHKPPIVLNEAWLNGAARGPESRLKIATDELDFLRWERSHKERQYENAVQHLFEISQKLTGRGVSRGTKTRDGLQELARGKRFILSSAYSGYELVGKVNKKKPFFFHTHFGINERITIDLGSQFRLFELRIFNRTDMCLDRARVLFYCVHDRLTPKLETSAPVWIDRDFVTSPTTLSVTPLGGKVGRYISIYSPLETALHLSSIELHGVSIPL